MIAVEVRNFGIFYFYHPGFMREVRWPRCCNLHYWAPPRLLALPKPEGYP